MFKLKQEKGITLIALVITVIVMLILAAVTITMAVNGGLFTYAGKAAKGTKEAISNEENIANGAIEINGIKYKTIDEYLQENDSLKNLPTYIETNKDNNTGVLKATAKYTDPSGKIAVIPKGFKLLSTDEKIDDGLAIQDDKGNEYIWIPIEDGILSRTGWWNNSPTTKTHEEILETDYTDSEYQQFFAEYKGYKNIETAIEGEGKQQANDFLAQNQTWKQLFQSTFQSRNWAGALDITNYTEEIPNELVNSVKNYKGFYLAKYEAGIGTSNQEIATTGRTNQSDITAPVIIKKNAYPYNFVNYSQANTLVTNMYLSKTNNVKDYGVTATLPYGSMWDEVLKFISSNEKNVTSSTLWGNHNDSTITGITGKYYFQDTDNTWKWGELSNGTKMKNSAYLLGTGITEYTKAKNLYDIAGNVYEWTNETYGDSGNVYRGGRFSNNGGHDPVCNRHAYTKNEAYSTNGFRPALYID